LKFIPNAPSVPSITDKGPYTLCQGDSWVLTASSVGPNKWSTGDTSRSIKVKSTGNYIVSIKDNSGCVVPSDTTKIKVLAANIPTISANRSTTMCTGDSVILTSSNAKSYLWNNNVNTASLKVKNAGTYSVSTIDNQGCLGTSNTVDVIVNLNPIATITPGGITTFCEGGSVMLSANSASTYLWSNGATTQNISVSNSSINTVNITDSKGCSAKSLPINVIVNSLPQFPTISIVGPGKFCLGDSIRLSSSIAANYLWNNGATNQEIVIKENGDYNVKITDINGCQNNSATFNANFKLIPKAEITPNGSTTICEGESVILTATLAKSYLWSTNETTQSITVDAKCNVNVMIEDNDGCLAISIPTTISVNPIPFKPIVTLKDKTLTSNSTEGNQWYLDGNKIIGAVSQSYTASTSGQYTVSVSNANNCQSISDPVGVDFNTQIMKITNKGSYLILPNPNNGAFTIKNNQIINGEIEIYNSIGILVFKSELKNQTINLADISKGLYTIKIIGDHFHASDKIIIQ
jgi:hypothetical protein